MTTDQNLNPWDKQPGESKQAYAAFRTFLNTPAHERSITRVSSELSKHIQLISRWNNRHDWLDRAEAWDRLQARRELDAELQQREEQRQHTLKIGKALRRKGVEAINHIDPSNLSVGQILSLLLEGEKMVDRATSDPEDLRERRDCAYAETDALISDRSEELEEAAKVYQSLIDKGILLPPNPD